MPQPRARSDKYWVDIFPETRNMTMRARGRALQPVSRSRSPKSIIRLTGDYDTDIQIPGATLVKDDTRLELSHLPLHHPAPARRIAHRDIFRQEPEPRD